MQKLINPHALFVGAFIPNWLLRRPEVSHGAKLCYARLCQYAGKNGECWPHQSTLANELSCSLRNVGYLLKELVDHGLILVKRRGKDLPAIYTFLWSEWMEIDYTQDSASQAGSDTQNCVLSDMQDSAPPFIYEENHKKRVSKRPSVKSLQSTTIEDLKPWIEEQKKAGISFEGIDISLELQKCKNNFLDKERHIGTARNWLLNTIKYAKPPVHTSPPARPQPAPSRGSTVVGSPEWEALQREAGLL
jgi:hypothetical protein